MNLNFKDNIPLETKSGIYQMNCKKINVGKQKEIWKLGLKNTLEILKIDKNEKAAERKTGNLS